MVLLITRRGSVAGGIFELRNNNYRGNIGSFLDDVKSVDKWTNTSKTKTKNNVMCRNVYDPESKNI